MTYICDVGYEPACGDVTVYCDEGTWLGIPLTCVQIGTRTQLGLVFCNICIRYQKIGVNRTFNYNAR